MWLEKIIHRKYGFNGYNNPTDFFVGLKDTLPKRKEGVKRIYFTGIPEHGNMGDQAIAYAMYKLTCDFKDEYELVTYTMSEFIGCLGTIKRDCKKGDIFFLIGGGNMGIAYFGNEEVRRMIIQMFPNNRIIIFPQTIDYGQSDEGKNQLLEATKIYGQHKDLHIFARESVSFDIMKKNFKDNNVYLVPDIVYTLEYTTEHHRSYILRCIRNDRESALNKADFSIIDTVLNKAGEVKVTDTVEPYVPIITNEEIRKKLIFRKLDEFAKAKFVITDRLHGMIFSVITKTPCIVVGNYNHKLISSYETWLKDFRDVYFVQNFNELSDLIENIEFDDKHEERLDKLRMQYEDIKKLL